MEALITKLERSSLFKLLFAGVIIVVLMNALSHIRTIQEWRVSRIRSGSEIGNMVISVMIMGASGVFLVIAFDVILTQLFGPAPDLRQLVQHGIWSAVVPQRP